MRKREKVLLKRLAAMQDITANEYRLILYLVSAIAEPKTTHKINIIEIGETIEISEDEVKRILIKFNDLSIIKYFQVTESVELIYD